MQSAFHASKRAEYVVGSTLLIRRKANIRTDKIINVEVKFTVKFENKWLPYSRVCSFWRMTLFVRVCFSCVPSGYHAIAVIHHFLFLYF